MRALVAVLLDTTSGVHLTLSRCERRRIPRRRGRNCRWRQRTQPELAAWHSAEIDAGAGRRGLRRQRYGQAEEGASYGA